MSNSVGYGGGGNDLRVLPEFLLPPEPRDTEQAEEDPAAGKKKMSKRERRQKGQNKNRPPPMQFTRGQRLCPVHVDVTAAEPVPTCLFPDCSFQHDVAAYVAAKPADIADECHVFNMLGRCPRGVTCRFGKAHIAVLDGGRVCNVEVAPKGRRRAGQADDGLPQQGSAGQAAQEEL